MSFRERPDYNPESEATFETDRRRFEERGRQWRAATETPEQAAYWKQDPARGWYPRRITPRPEGYDSSEIFRTPEWQALRRQKYDEIYGHGAYEQAWRQDPARGWYLRQIDPPQK
jgi:hypothetical protein